MLLSQSPALETRAPAPTPVGAGVSTAALARNLSNELVAPETEQLLDRHTTSSQQELAEPHLSQCSSGGPLAKVRISVRVKHTHTTTTHTHTHTHGQTRLHRRVSCRCCHDAYTHTSAFTHATRVPPSAVSQVLFTGEEDSMGPMAAHHHHHTHGSPVLVSVSPPPGTIFVASPSSQHSPSILPAVVASRSDEREAGRSEDTHSITARISPCPSSSSPPSSHLVGTLTGGYVDSQCFLHPTFPQTALFSQAALTASQIEEEEEGEEEVETDASQGEHEHDSHQLLHSSSQV